ncbi:MAG: cytochromesubunit B of the bc complex-like protein, partial [Candidatus Dormibacteria bacterium]
RRYAAPRETVPFFPNQLFKDVALSTLLIAVIFVMGLISGAPLDAAANPATLTYVPTPEWFFLPLDQFLVVAPTNPLIAIGIFGVLGLGGALMVLLPFIDRSPERRPLRRPEVIIPALFMAFTVIFFAVLGINRLYNL